MEITVFQGKEILPYIQDVANLRIEIFREWPYLYEGSMQSEMEYLEMYNEVQDAIWVLAKDGKKVVGVAMGLPIAQSMKPLKDLFLEKDLSMGGWYYFSDVILLKEFRRQGIGLKMIEEFENAICKLQKYDRIVGCEIVRDEGDRRKPSSYQSLDSFWDRLGFKILPHWHVSFSYLDIGEKEKTDHLMRFRVKSLITA